MMVPSRSRKTAGDFALVEVMFEAGDQFVARNSCGAQFSDDHGAGMVGNLRRFKRRRVAYQREGEHRDGGIACTGNIENIPGLRRDVMWSFPFFEKHHPVLAKGDQKILHAPFLEQRFSGVDKIDIFLRRYFGIAIWNPSGEKRFGPIWFHRRHSAPIDQVVRIRVGRNEFLGRAGFTRDLHHQFARDKAFAVIFEDDRVDVGQLFPDRAHDFSDLRGRGSGEFFAVDPYYLLMPGDDSRLNNGREFFIFDRIRDVDLALGQQLAQLLAAPVLSDQTDHRNAIEKFAKIAGDIGGAAGKETFACHLDYRHWRFRRNPADFAPDEFVQHQVADNEDALARRAVENLPEPF